MKKTMLKGFLLLVLLFGLGGLARQVAAQAPTRPVDSTVLDKTGLLSQETIAQIDAENRSWAQTDQQLQVGVLFLESLDGQDLESLANETFRSWQIGFSGTDNGILLLIALEDRVFRLETSDQAATVLPDVEAKRILDNSREFFREEDYNQGVLYIVDAIGDRFYGTDRAQARLDDFQEESTSDNGFAIGLIWIVIVILIIISNTRSGGRGGRGGGGSDLLWWLLATNNSSSSSRSSSSSGSFGGGGWSGGGGGGGGASSGW